MLRNFKTTIKHPGGVGGDFFRLIYNSGGCEVPAVGWVVVFTAPRAATPTQPPRSSFHFVTYLYPLLNSRIRTPLWRAIFGCASHTSDLQHRIPLTYSSTPHRAPLDPHRLQPTLIIPYRRNACQVVGVRIPKYEAPKERQTQLREALRFLHVRTNKAPRPLAVLKAFSDHAPSRSQNITRTPSEVCSWGKPQAMQDRLPACALP